MVKGNRSYEFGMAPALVMALCTTYRIVMGIINLKRTKKVDNVFIKDLRIISLKDALLALSIVSFTLRRKPNSSDRSNKKR